MKKLKLFGKLGDSGDTDGLYRWLDSINAKKRRRLVDSSVDKFLSKNQRFVRRRRISFDILKGVPVRKLVAVLMSLVILFVMIPSL